MSVVVYCYLIRLYRFFGKERVVRSEREEIVVLFSCFFGQPSAILHTVEETLRTK